MKKKHVDIIIETNGFKHLSEVQRLNKHIFKEDRLINRLDHDPLIFLTAHYQGELAGFKIGYALNRHIFYSAKGATNPLFRRTGIATRLLYAMIREANNLGYDELQYDTFPARFPGMLILGLHHNFRILRLDWNSDYHDFQIRLTRTLNNPVNPSYPI